MRKLLIRRFSSGFGSWAVVSDGAAVSGGAVVSDGAVMSGGAAVS